MFYFSFTTLSTVGLGDFHPKNDFEKMMMVPFMFVGVICFSFITGQFLELTDRIIKNN